MQAEVWNHWLCASLSSQNTFTFEFKVILNDKYILPFVLLCAPNPISNEKNIHRIFLSSLTLQANFSFQKRTKNRMNNNHFFFFNAKHLSQKPTAFSKLSIHFYHLSHSESSQFSLLLLNVVLRRNIFFSYSAQPTSLAGINSFN